MNIELIIQSVMGLVALLAFLVFLLLFSSNKKETKKKKVVTKKNSSNKAVDKTPNNLNELRAIIKDKKSTTEELRSALELIIKNYGTIHKKLGVRAHPDFDLYMDVVFTICRHPNADKYMIIYFERELGKLNPEYKQDINEALVKGLNSRRV
jgi:hypothetical protein